MWEQRGGQAGSGRGGHQTGPLCSEQRLSDCSQGAGEHPPGAVPRVEAAAAPGPGPHRLLLLLPAPQRRRLRVCGSRERHLLQNGGVAGQQGERACRAFVNRSRATFAGTFLFNPVPAVFQVFPIVSLIMLSLCYLPGIIAAFLQLYRGTKYKSGPMSTRTEVHVHRHI